MRLNFAHDLVPTFNHVQGLNIASGHRLTPLHYIVERGVLGALSESFGIPTIAFQLPEKPFRIGERLELNDQHFVVSVSRISTGLDESHTFWTPFRTSYQPVGLEGVCGCVRQKLGRRSKGSALFAQSRKSILKFTPYRNSI